MDPFIGALMCVAFDYPPKGWAKCDGSLLPIAQNAALFSLLGTTYGGDGVQTFRLPDLRGRAPVSSGQGPGLSSYTLGQQGGAETVTLDATTIPPHTHAMMASAVSATTNVPTGNVLAAAAEYIASPPDPSASAMGNEISATPAQPHENHSPYLAMNWVIALQGIFPSRD
jgi:microcystin-dependent protein